MTATHCANLLEALKISKPFHCEGKLTLAEDQLNLFYGSGNVAGRLSLATATPGDIEALGKACAPATFGRNAEDVLDPSYRKALKLDRKDFAINLDISGTGVLDTIVKGLFDWDDKARAIKAELYKLNIYGEGSFFKAHKDTPRAESMFGSIVVAFPTAHKGGALHLRHDGKEFIFDSGAMEFAPNEVAWIAFYSDVEHEVTPVVSGYRVTLTYNLYFAENQAPDSTTTPPDPLLAAFSKLVADKEFLSTGGTLGFGLKHEYPLPMTQPSDDTSENNILSDLTARLKGVDAALMSAAQASGLKAYLGVVYELGDDQGTYMVPFWWNGFGECESLGEVFDEWEEDAKCLVGSKYSQKPIWPVEWVTAGTFQKNVPISSQYVAYGNEAGLACMYGHVNLFVEVPEAGNRAQA